MTREKYNVHSIYRLLVENLNRRLQSPLILLKCEIRSVSHKCNINLHVQFLKKMQDHLQHFFTCGLQFF
jgi:hypothetical protein